jgi:hypothetical protein
MGDDISVTPDVTALSRTRPDESPLSNGPIFP